MYAPSVPSRQQPNMVGRPRATGRGSVELARPRDGSEPAEERRRLGAVADVLDVFGALLEGEEGRHRGRRDTLCGGGGRRRREAAALSWQGAPLRLRGLALGRSHICPPCMRPSSWVGRLEGFVGCCPSLGAWATGLVGPFLLGFRLGFDRFGVGMGYYLGIR